jgi:hypothetical protein
VKFSQLFILHCWLLLSEFGQLALFHIFTFWVSSTAGTAVLHVLIRSNWDVWIQAWVWASACMVFLVVHCMRRLHIRLNWRLMCEMRGKCQRMLVGSPNYSTVVLLWGPQSYICMCASQVLFV